MKINKKQWVILSIFILLVAFSAVVAVDQLSQTYYDYYVSRAVWGFFFRIVTYTLILAPVFYILRDKKSKKPSE